MRLKATVMPLMAAVAVGMTACSSKQQTKDSDSIADNAPESTVLPLHVEGTALLYSDGDTAVLTGPSLGWHGNWGRFYNAGTVKALKEKWGANITRAAIGAHASGDCVGNYDEDPENAVRRASDVIDAAIDNGMYIICDWHSHNNTAEDAKKFFSAISEKYGDSPNVIYEIWNEPLEIEWQEIKDYAADVVPAIRKNAPNAVVIVGTPKWDQEVMKAAESPIDMPNLLYSLHFYAGMHKDWLRDQGQQAIDAGLPLIISECGGMMHTGDGPLDYKSWQAWVDFADRNKLSMLMWDIADKDETCSMLTPDAPDNGMEWTDAHLKEWAKLALHTTRSRNNPDSSAGTNTSIIDMIPIPDEQYGRR